MNSRESTWWTDELLDLLKKVGLKNFLRSSLEEVRDGGGVALVAAELTAVVLVLSDLSDSDGLFLNMCIVVVGQF